MKNRFEELAAARQRLNKIASVIRKMFWDRDCDIQEVLFIADVMFKTKPDIDLTLLTDLDRLTRLRNHTLKY